MRAQYIGLGLNNDDYLEVLRALESKTKPDETVKPLTFRYDGCTVKISEMPYVILPEERKTTIEDFYRAICLDMDSPDPVKDFNNLVRGHPQLILFFERSDPRQYPFLNLRERHLGMIVQEPELLEAE